MIYTKDLIKQKLDKKEQKAKILKIIYIPIILLIVLGAASIIFQKVVEKKENISLFGYRAFVVLTGSMEPNISVGDLVFIKSVEQTELKQGDIITFTLSKGKETITHRIIEIVEQDGQKLYRTKGDNNNAQDSELVSYNNVLGKLSFRIYKLGALLRSFTTTGGIALIILIVLISWSHSSKKNNKILAREEARKKYNFKKYKDNRDDIDDTI